MHRAVLSPVLTDSSRVLRDVGRALVGAEREIALLSRCTPLDAAGHGARLVDAWQRGVELRPVLQYAPWKAPATLVRGLEHCAEHAADHGVVGELLGERARELLLEVQLVESIGSSRFGRIACRRYGSDTEHAEADALAEQWLAEAPTSTDASERIPCDDSSDPRSLASVLRAEIGRMRLPIRVEVSARLMATAAAAPGVVTIAAGRSTTVLDARRIAAHELFGHCVPMLNAERLRTGAPHGPLLVAGSAAGTETQEGWALWVEERLGLMHAERRRVLSLRHVAARRASQGASFVDVMRALRGLGASAETSVRIALRALRGGAGENGGLARELVYLRAAVAVTAACRQGSTRQWLQLGRVSLGAAERLQASLPATALATDAACMLDADVAGRWLAGADRV